MNVKPRIVLHQIINHYFINQRLEILIKAMILQLKIKLSLEKFFELQTI